MEFKADAVVKSKNRVVVPKKLIDDVFGKNAFSDFLVLSQEGKKEVFIAPFTFKRASSIFEALPKKTREEINEYKADASSSSVRIYVKAKEGKKVKFCLSYIGEEEVIKGEWR